MPGSTWTDFKKIKEEITIEDVLNRYVLLDRFSRKGDQLSGPCPIHKGEGKKSFSASNSKGVWKCFSCGKSGNVIDLVIAIENVDLRTAAIMLQDWFCIEPDSKEKRSKQVKKTPAKNEKKKIEVAKSKTEPEVKENKPLEFQLQLDSDHPYLESRGLTPETVKHFGLGYCGRGSMKGRIGIPIDNAGGELVAYAGRWAGPDEEIPDGEGKYNYRPDFIRALKSIISGG